MGIQLGTTVRARAGVWQGNTGVYARGFQRRRPRGKEVGEAGIVHVFNKSVHRTTSADNICIARVSEDTGVVCGEQDGLFLYGGDVEGAC